MFYWADGHIRRPEGVVRGARILRHRPLSAGGRPTFDMSISDFREKFNAQNPKLQLNEFRAIASSRDRENLTRAASKINENLYASTALERGTLKIKSMQVTGYLFRGPSRKRRRPKRRSI